MVYILPNSQAKPPKLDPEKVPNEVRKFIPLAEKYGISDDGYREDVIGNLDRVELLELTTFISNIAKEVGNWLCGPESDTKNPTKDTSLLLA